MLLKLTLLIWCLAFGPNPHCMNEIPEIPFNIDLKYSFEIHAPRSNQIRENNHQSLFGSSVLVISNGRKQNLLVGASNLASKMDSFLYTGGLFQCDIKLTENEHARCAEIDVSTVKSPVNYQARNRSLIGFNIGNTNSPNGVISCAPNWVAGTNVSEGICFFLNRTTRYVKLNTKFPKYIDKFLFGFSLPYNQHSQKTIVGNPGWNTFTGSLGTFHNSGFASQFNQISGSMMNSYLGYAVEICSFPQYSNVVAVSSPRIERFGGKVEFYVASNVDYKLFELSSEEIGEYFGASLLAISFSVNTKKNGSLLVGAPMFSSTTDKREVGQVYYYKNLIPRDKSSHVAIKISPRNGGQVGGRFGTTMASIDLNKDGYYDAIISAPFENENQGAIYIYYGSNNGLILNTEKRIGSEDVLKLQPPLRGFGYSLWTQSDLDSNGLNDLVIGSILSDKVVILRTMPIITMKFERVNFGRINLTDTSQCPSRSNNPCFQVNFCINIKSTQQTLRDTAIIVVNITVTDRKLRIKEKRVLVGQSSQRLSVKQNQTKICSKFSEKIKRKDELYDIVTPIEFMLSATLDSPSQRPLKFCPQCPIAAPVTLYKEIDFAHGCFPENCVSSLKLAVLFKYGPDLLKNIDIVQGTFDHIEMVITVTNKAEDSIDTFLYIKIEPFRSALKSQDESRCTIGDHQLYECEVNKLLQMNQTEEFKLLFDVSSRELQSNRFNFSFEIASKSYLDSQSVTNFFQTINITKEAEFNLIESNKVMEKNHIFSEQTPEIRFPISILVNKKGPSLVHSAYLQFYLPDGPIQYNQSSRCIQVNTVSSNNFDLVNDTLQLHCTEHKCSKYECTIDTLHQGDDTANLDLTFTFKPSKILSHIQRVSLQIDAQLVIKDEPFFVANKSYASISSVVNFERQVFLLSLLQHKYKYQMMVAGGGVGLLILMATVFVLVKKGFFRRRKREELLQMKEKRKTMLWANQTPDVIPDGRGGVEKEDDEESVEEIKE